MFRQESQSTLTIVNDIQSDALEIGSFALVVPVPEVITADTANVLEPEVFDRLDAYSQPRLVRYECSDFEVNEDDFSDGGGGTTGGFEEPNAGGVEIEAHFVEGEYEILLYLQLVQRGYIPGSMIIISSTRTSTRSITDLYRSGFVFYGRQSIAEKLLEERYRKWLGTFSSANHIQFSSLSNPHKNWNTQFKICSRCCDLCHQ